MDSQICKFNPYKNRVLLFPGIYSFHCTRLILSYFTTFELRTIISRLNKWSNLFISQTQNLSVVYGRTDPCISILYRPIEDSPVQLKKFDHEKLKTNIAEISDFPMDLTNFKSVETSKNSVYVIGGMNKLTNQIISFCYKITSLPSIKLQEVCPMNYPRISFSLTSCGLFIYVIGGFYDGTTKICEKLNISANRWEAFPALNIARCNPILCSFNSNIIYAFGGTDGHTPLNSIEKYENSKNQWVLLPPLLQICIILLSLYKENTKKYGLSLEYKNFLIWMVKYRLPACFIKNSKIKLYFEIKLFLPSSLKNVLCRNYITHF